MATLHPSRVRAEVPKVEYRCSGHLYDQTAVQAVQETLPGSLPAVNQRLRDVDPIAFVTWDSHGRSQLARPAAHICCLSAPFFLCGEMLLAETADLPGGPFCSLSLEPAIKFSSKALKQATTLSALLGTNCSHLVIIPVFW